MTQTVLAERHALALERLDQEAQTVEVFWNALLLRVGRMFLRAIDLVDVGEQAEECCV